MAVYINGEQVNGCTNYASAVSCVDKDGNPSTVQAEIDGLNDTVDTLSNTVSEQNKNLTASDNLKFRFATDGEGNYGYLKADDSFVPFKSDKLDFSNAYANYSTSEYNRATTVPAVVGRTYLIVVTGLNSSSVMANISGATIIDSKHVTSRNYNGFYRDLSIFKVKATSTTITTATNLISDWNVIYAIPMS